jgi:hypothetical protein
LAGDSRLSLALSRDLYGPQFKDWKGSADIEQMTPEGMAQKAEHEERDYKPLDSGEIRVERGLQSGLFSVRR